MTYTKFVGLWLLLTLFGCQPEAAPPQALSITLPPDDDVTIILPTASPTSTQTPTELPATVTSTATVTASSTATTSPTITPSVPTVTAITPQMRVDHYALNRPIAPQGVDYLDRTYAYGDTQLGRRPIHHGVEFVNPRGTPVLATAGGSVFYAGDDSEMIFGPQPDYYGLLVVIQHGITAPEGQPIYTLYGHLDRVDVETGQAILPGGRVGIVGDTGVADGPHLHFEVRVDDPMDFNATRNPDLWIYPYPGFGTLAGRVIDPAGDFLEAVEVQVISVETGVVRYAYTYAYDRVNGSAAWGENFTYGDLPQGAYTVLISRDGRRLFEREVMIAPGMTTWVEIELNRDTLN